MLRIGDVDVWGKEVNSASKLCEDRAQAREILVTEAVKVAHEGSLVRFEPAGAGFTENEAVCRVVSG